MGVVHEVLENDIKAELERKYDALHPMEKLNYVAPPVGQMLVAMSESIGQIALGPHSEGWSDHKESTLLGWEREGGQQTVDEMYPIPDA